MIDFWSFVHHSMLRGELHTITSELGNRHVAKALFTSIVYTNNNYYY